MNLAQTLVNGILIGGVFALVAVGLTLIFGVMDVINFAHGSFVMVGMYVAFFVWSIVGLDPLAAIPIDAAILAAGGWLAYRVVVKPMTGKTPLAQIVGTFGMLVLLEGGAQLLFTPNSRAVAHPLASELRFVVGGLVVGGPQLAGFLGAIICTGMLALFVNKTETGNALRATGEDRVAASLMGVNAQRMHALAWMLGIGCTGVAGALLVNSYSITPDAGQTFGLIAFITVALGGFGSILGAGIAGVSLGVIQGVVGLYAAQYSLVAIVALYLVVVLIRPQGLLGSR